MKKIVVAGIVILGSLFINGVALAAVGVTITPINNTSISADNTNGSYTLLTGPIFAEKNAGDIKSGTITITAPSGFIFDTGSPVTILLTSASASSSTNINHVASGTSMATVLSSSTIKFTITSQSTSTKNTLTWQNIKVRPLNGAPLSNGNISVSSTGLITGVTLPVSVGALTEIAGSVNNISVTSSTSTVQSGSTLSFSATSTDQFGNATSTTFIWSIVPGTGTGSINSSGLFTAVNAGTVTIKATSGSVFGTSNTITITALDTTAPVLSFIDGVDANGPVATDTISINFDDATTKLYSILAANKIGTDCSTTTAQNKFTAYTGSLNLTNTNDTGKYICAYGQDASGNVSVLLSTSTLNIGAVSATPVITITNPSTSSAQFKTITATTSIGTLGYATTTGTICNGSLTFSTYSDITFSSESDNGVKVCYQAVNGNKKAYSLSNPIDGVDVLAPVITIVGTSTISIEVHTSYSDLGATANDNLDGDLTTSINTVNSVDENTVGDYTVTYDVTDPAGNQATQAVRTVHVVDTTLPIITLLGSNPQEVQASTTYSDAGATSSDNYDGDLTANINVTTNVDTSVVGTYWVKYNVTDANGNAAVEVTRTVNVVDTVAPIISLSGANLQTIEFGNAYTELGATAYDDFDGDISNNIVIGTSTLNVNVLGSYGVTYDVTDANTNAATQAVRTVNVVDSVFPTITLIGNKSITMYRGVTYFEPGATASDNYDGDLTSNIVASGTVNRMVVGTYILTYAVSDSSGHSTSTTRKVSVIGRSRSGFVQADASTPADTTAPDTTPAASPEPTPEPTPVVEAPVGEVLGAANFFFAKDLHRGLKTIPDITELQDRLRTEGFFTASSTGYFGNLTFVAVKKYQKAHTIIQTGFVGPITRAALNK